MLLRSPCRPRCVDQRLPVGLTISRGHQRDLRHGGRRSRRRGPGPGAVAPASTKLFLGRLADSLVGLDAGPPLEPPRGTSSRRLRTTRSCSNGGSRRLHETQRRDARPPPRYFILLRSPGRCSTPSAPCLAFGTRLPP